MAKLKAKPKIDMIIFINKAKTGLSARMAPKIAAIGPKASTDISLTKNIDENLYSLFIKSPICKINLLTNNLPLLTIIYHNIMTNGYK